MADATIYSSTFGEGGNSSVDLDNTRRKFNFGERVAELAPQHFALTCKYDNYGKIAAAAACTFLLPGQLLAVKADDGEVYNFKIKQTAVVNSAASTAHDGTDIAHQTSGNKTEVSGEMISVVGKTIPNGTVFTAGNKGQVVGSAWAEGTIEAEVMSSKESGQINLWNTKWTLSMLCYMVEVLTMQEVQLMAQA